MNMKQLQYAISLSKTRSFSQTSELMNISQPALSKQILNLEKDLGIKLFDRNTIPFTMTPAGDFFIRQAQKLVNQENYLLRALDQYKSGEKGRLTIGLSPFRALHLIPPIVKKLQERFPGVEICLQDTNSEQVRRDVEEGVLDFAIVNLPVDETVFDYTPIEPDTLALAVPNEMLGALSLTAQDNLPEIDFAMCKNLPFVVVEQGKEMRKLFDSLCASADFYPEISMEVVGITTAWAMVRSGIGATILPLQFAHEETFDRDSITLFTIKNNAYSRQPVVITRKGQYISQHAQYAIALLKEISAKK